MKSIDEIVKDLITQEHELTEKVAELQKAEKELQKVRAALEALTPGFAKVHNAQKSLKIATYPKDGTWRNKIEFITKLQKASVKEMLRFVLEQEPDLNPTTVFNSLSTTVNTMYNKTKELDATNNGGANEYFWKGER